MYRSYFNSANSASRYRYSYPDYTNSYLNLYRGRRMFAADDSYLDLYKNTYFYGGGRRRKHFWERDYSWHCNHRSRRNRNRRGDGDKGDSSPERDDSPPPPKPEAPKEELVKMLHVKKINLHIDENVQKHRTDEYDCVSERKEGGKVLPAELVVRRGDSFKVTITLDRPYSNEKTDMVLNFSIGKRHQPSHGNEAVIEVDETGKKKYKQDEWGANKVSATGNDVTLMVYIPANCIVGEWNMYVKSFSFGKDKSGKEKTLTYQYEYEDDITILFNPWCPDDGTYMKMKTKPKDGELKDELEEYVLNPSGCVWQGNAWTRGAKEWNFGQFEKYILDAALHLMRLGFGKPTSKKAKQMSDPMKVARAIAKVVNSQDDNGVLNGNWSGNYDGGVSPSAWVGSVKILQQYMKTEQPVSFGQCWVFSCVTTTVCRALGIPCRTVTNFASAHDTDESNTIDKYFKKNVYGVLEKTDSSDSVWNFHVWNEVWLARPDLVEEEFDGWQVIDATPQETSEGFYTCGPCPVAAVKKGMCDKKFDTAFVFSEVNADEVHWELLPGGGEKRIDIRTTKIGKNISTKIPDGKPYKEKNRDRNDDWRLSEKKRQDLTDEYKFPEKSDKEREAIMMAHKTARFPKPGAYDDLKAAPPKPIEFGLNHSNEVMVGQDLDIELTAKNSGKNKRHISLASIWVSPKTYTGETGKIFFTKDFESQYLDSGKSTSLKVTLKPDDYLPHLVEQASLYIEASTIVDKVGNEDIQMTMKAHDFRFRRPDLTVEARDATAKLKENVVFDVSFTNPLPVPMKNCKISMESTGFEDVEDETVPDVPAKGEFKKEFKLVARKVSKKEETAVVFSFDCKTLRDIAGSGSIKITK